MRLITDLVIPAMFVGIGATPTPVGDWISIGKTFGVPVMLLGYFLIRDWRRAKDDQKSKQELVLRLDKVVDAQQEQLRQVVVDNTKAMTAVGETLRDFAKSRPCLVK